MTSERCTVVVGCQWGDEGKGKVVDVLAESADVVARYQGGANAGHTVHVGDEEFVLHQIPSGILHPLKRCLLGNGVVLDLEYFFQEYDALARRGIDLAARIGVSQRAHLLLPYHRLLDRISEEGRSATRIGTTGRGIGPAYEDKVGRRGLRVADLADERRTCRELDAALDCVEARLRELGAHEPLDRPSITGLILQMRERILPLAVDTGLEITGALAAGRRVLLEGAQGTALDLDHGTYPFVTSSNTTAAAAATGVGIGPTRIDTVIGVVKAYTTRVGNGPLPTEVAPELGARFRELGSEYGATTGRPRRCGWFDGVVARYAARVNGLTGLAVTKLDVLDTLPEIRIARAYRIHGEPCTEFPADTVALDHVESVYETLPGWLTPIGDARRMEDLPGAARRYLERIEEVAGAPIRMISVGSRRNQVILTA